VQLIVGVPKEIVAGERRVALTPTAVKALVGDGLEIHMECGAGEAAGFPDEDYVLAGAKVQADAAGVFEHAGVVLKVQPPSFYADGRHEVDALRGDVTLISFLRPLDEPELAKRLAERGITSLAMELMPRITRAQSMDSLSAMSTLSGYRAVLLAATALPRIFPMLVTAAGTISPARVLVIGAGVAGLQAIATARRLGAVVESYDTRDVVKEQVESLGAKFVELDLDTGDSEDAGGYAKAQDEAFYERQREQLGKRVAASDIVITTALVPGRPAPVLIDEAAVLAMRPGSVIVDLAAENGGNCVCTQANQTVEVNGVTIIGATNLPSDIPADASQMYAKNLTTFLRHLIDDGALVLDLEDEITRGALLTHQGKITNDAVRERAESAS